MGEIPDLGKNKPQPQNTPQQRATLDFQKPERAVPILDSVLMQLQGVLTSITQEPPRIVDGLQVTQIVTPDFMAMVQQLLTVTMYARQASIVLASTKMEANSRLVALVTAMDGLAKSPDEATAKVAREAVVSDGEQRQRYADGLRAMLQAGFVAKPRQPGETPQ